MKITRHTAGEAIFPYIAYIPENCSEVLRLRYYQGMTREKCGGALGIGVDRVLQMERKGIGILRQPKYAACLRPFFDYDFYWHTGLSAFLHAGMSVQERYLVIEEERKERAKQRRKERDAKQRETRYQSDREEKMEQAMREAQEKVARMTPEEKERLLKLYGLA